MSRLPVPRTEDGIVQAENELLGKALAVADRGYQLMYERLDEMGPRDLVAASKAAGLLVSAKRRWSEGGGAGDGNSMVALAAKLAEIGGGSVRIDISREADAIDVTPLCAVDQIPG